MSNLDSQMIPTTDGSFTKAGPGDNDPWAFERSTPNGIEPAATTLNTTIYVSGDMNSMQGNLQKLESLDMGGAVKDDPRSLARAAIMKAQVSSAVETQKKEIQNQQKAQQDALNEIANIRRNSSLSNPEAAASEVARKAGLNIAALDHIR